MQEWLGSTSTPIFFFLIFFFHIHLHLCCLLLEGLFHFFILCEKFTFGFVTFFVKHLGELYQQVVLLLLYYAIGK